MTDQTNVEPEMDEWEKAEPQQVESILSIRQALMTISALETIPAVRAVSSWICGS